MLVPSSFLKPLAFQSKEHHPYILYKTLNALKINTNSSTHSDHFMYVVFNISWETYLVTLYIWTTHHKKTRHSCRCECAFDGRGYIVFLFTIYFHIASLVSKKSGYKLQAKFKNSKAIDTHSTHELDRPDRILVCCCQLNFETKRHTNMKE